MNKFFWQNKVIWITGASSGVGYQLAKTLLNTSCQLILSGRNINKLESLINKNISTPPLILAFDITDKNACQIACETIKKQFHHIDLLILNAGVCPYFDINNFKSHIIEQTMLTNMLSSSYILEHSLTMLRKSQNAIIVSITSLASIAGLPFGMGGYSASKAALDKFMESLAIELYPEKIKVLTISPGFINTPMAQKNPFVMPWIASPQKAVNKIIHAIEKKRSTTCFPKQLSIIFRLTNLLPRKYYYKIMFYLSKRLKKD